MKQVFFITGDHLTATLWQSNHIVGQFEFSQNEVHLEALKSYLKESNAVPVHIIVDVLEEEIGVTHMPYVIGTDRKNLINRTVNRTHRQADYFYAEIIGRAKTGRRDSELLITALNNADWLKRWLNIFSEFDLRIAGICSLPVISGSLLPFINKEKGLVLLVSQQSVGYIRQSFFKDSKLYFSRNIPTDDENLSNEVVKDLKNTRKYLENQRLVTLTEEIDVVFIVDQALYDKIKDVEKELSGLNVRFIYHQGLQELLKIKSDFIVGGREIYAGLLKRIRVKNHYARKKEMASYKQKKIYQAASVGIYLSMLMALMAGFKLTVDGYVMNEQTQIVHSRYSQLKINNEQLQGNLDQLPVKALKMKSFVEDVQYLNQAQNYSIKDAMVLLSHVFENFSTINLVGIDWDLIVQKENNEKIFHEKIDLNAVMEFEGSNRKVLSTLDAFVDAIKSLPGIKQVEIVEKPLNVTSADSVLGDIKNRNAKDLKFKLSILKKAGAVL